MLNLSEIAARLDADEKLKLKYRFPVSTGNGNVRYEIRTAKLLDVAVESNVLYVSHENEVIWIKLEEAIEVTEDCV